MNKGISVHIGLNRVNPNAYNGWEGVLSGCINDANAMEAICRSEGFSTSTFLDDRATASDVLAAIRGAVSVATAGDLIVVTYAGHGGQLTDTNGDEADGKDETWVLFDRMVIDDELKEIYGIAPAGCGIVVISDSCHSGTVVRDGPPEYALAGTSAAPIASYNMANNGQVLQVLSDGRDAPNLGVAEDRGLVRVANLGVTLPAQRLRDGGLRMIPPQVAQAAFAEHIGLYHSIFRGLQVRRALTRVRGTANQGPAMVLISGCQDNQTSLDGDGHGLFTQRLLDTWNLGTFVGDYRTFHAKILTQMPAEQTPQFGSYGPAGDSLSGLRPFQIPTASVVAGGSPTNVSSSPVVDRAVIPSPLRRNDKAPTITVELGAGRWYELEFTTKAEHMQNDLSFIEPGHYATWMLSPTHRRDGSFTIPNDWWQAIRNSDQLWVGLHTVGMSAGWSDAYRAAELVWAPIDGARARDGEIVVWAPETVYAGDGAPKLQLDVGVTPYFELELANDPAMFTDASLRTSGGYSVTWDLRPWPGFMSGSRVTVPDEAWNSLIQNEWVAVRAHGSSRNDGWFDYQVSEYVWMHVLQASSTGNPNNNGGSTNNTNTSSSTAVLQPGDHVWYWNGLYSQTKDIPRSTWFPGSTGESDYLGHGREIYNFVVHADGEIRRGQPHLKGGLGTHAWINNNPGNIMASSADFGQYPGKVNWHSFMIFPTEDLGFAAIARLLRGSGYRDLTIGRALAKYAPSGDGGNDPVAYGAAVAQAAGVSNNTLIRELTDDQMLHVQNKIRQVEGWVAGDTLTVDSPELPTEIRQLL